MEEMEKWKWRGNGAKSGVNLGQKNRRLCVIVHGLGLISRYFLGIVPKTYFASDKCVKFAKLGDICAKIGEGLPK